MFTGIVETTGTVRDIQLHHEIKKITLVPNMPFDDLHLGDSVAVNGVCLTVVEFDNETIVLDVVPETLRCTNLGVLSCGDEVNLERALLPNQRLGGHFVQGHVDMTLKILDINEEGDAWMVRFELPEAISPYVVHKGFVTIDGMSLTVANLDREQRYFSVTLIPHTRQVTIAKHYLENKTVNFEVDMLAKYVENFQRKF